MATWFTETHPPPLSSLTFSNMSQLALGGEGGSRSPQKGPSTSGMGGWGERERERENRCNDGQFEHNGTHARKGLRVEKPMMCVWSGLVYGMVWYGIEWYGMVWYRMVW